LVTAPLAIVGAVGNVVNIRTFFSMGVSDGVSVSLAWQAASDLLFLVSVVISSAAIALHGFEKISEYTFWCPVDPEAVSLVFNNTGSGSYAITMLVTTYVTGVRCLSVARPLRFRNFPALKKTTLVLSVFTSLCIASVIALLVFVGVSPNFDTKLNATRPILWISPQRKVTKDIIFGLRDAFLPFVSQILVSLCVVVMATSLREASHFRQKYSSQIALKNRTPNTSAHTSIVRDPLQKMNTVTLAAEPQTARGKSSTKLTGKDLQVVRQMLVIASVYWVCNVPKTAFNLTTIIFTDFNKGGRYEALYTTTNFLRQLIQVFNAGVGIFIYWNFNSRFR
ncbi:unnamed protein product, partial [Lymnaea stagnalis]